MNQLRFSLFLVRNMSLFLERILLVDRGSTVIIKPFYSCETTLQNVLKFFEHLSEKMYVLHMNLLKFYRISRYQSM